MTDLDDRWQRVFLVHSNAADTQMNLSLNRLRQDGDIKEAISPNFLVRNWSPAFTERSTQAEATKQATVTTTTYESGEEGAFVIIPIGIFIAE